MALLRSLSFTLNSTLFTRFTPCMQKSTKFSAYRHFASQAHSTNSHQNENLTDSLYHRHYKQATLCDRIVLRVTGMDSINYLQSILTNDISLLLNDKSPQQCIYAFMLHSNGRIHADMFIYRFPHRPDEFLLEVDASIQENFRKHLSRYKVRRKVQIREEPNYSVNVIFPESPGSAVNLPLENLTNQDENNLIVSDPRTPHIGYRMICINEGKNELLPSLSPILTKQNESFNSVTIQPSDRIEYRIFRYRLGIGEGAIDFPWEIVFPFDANADLLNAVSFNKGCYIGQELVARTYHTGVIRKRFVPIELGTLNDANFAEFYPPQNVIIEGEEGSVPRVMGRFLVNQNQYGIASLKYKEVFGSIEGEEAEESLLPSAIRTGILKLAKDGQLIKAQRPFWWPKYL